MGSGTVAKVAKENNRNYIGFELNSDYCGISKNRLKDESE
jgi:DNA modification methylase